ncbi:MAG: tetratricopeptide repeat protein [Magnetococcus sp. DMHC-1]
MNQHPPEPLMRVDRQRLRAIQLLVEGYRRTLINPAPMDLATEGLAGVGLELFDLGLAPSWASVQARLIPGLPLRLVIVSSIPEVLNLPWEVTRLPDGRVLGLDTGVGLRRLPDFAAPVQHCCSVLPPRPLRVILAISVPADAEEHAAIPVESLTSAFLEAIAGTGAESLLTMTATGSVAELREHIRHLQPQLVILCGPVRIQRGDGFFGFEAGDGRLDLHTSHEMYQELFLESGVQCLMLIGCHASAAPPLAATSAICAAVVQNGMPLAVAFPTVETAFLTPFLQGVAQGLPLETALNQARNTCRSTCGEQSPPTWTLPMLFGGSQQGFLFNVAALSASVHPQPKKPDWDSPPGMHLGVAGHFWGRRPGTEGLLTGLREKTIGLLHVSGPQASGKSSLIVRLVRGMADLGHPVLAVAGTPANPVTAARLLQSVIPVLKRQGFKSETSQLKDGSLPIRDRLAHLVDVLTRQQGLILLLDDVQPWPTPGEYRGNSDPDLAWFFYLFWQKGPGETRILVTGPDPLHWPEPLPAWVTRLALEPLPVALLAGIALRERSIVARLTPGPEGWNEVQNACQRLPGHPAWVRPVLATDPGQLASVPVADSLTAFFATWSGDERRQLTQAALPHLALPTEGICQVTGMESDQLFGWLDAGIIDSWHPPGRERLWKVPPGIRDWLLRTEDMSSPHIHEAQRRIGAYLLRMFEENREEILGLTWVDILMEARFHWAQGGDLPTAAAISGKISHGLEIQGLFAELERVNRQFLLWGSHPSPLFWIAQSCLGRGELEQAMEWLQRSRESVQDQDGYWVEQAAAWQGEAEIQLTKGRLEAARNGFHAAMTLLHTAGDREGEAAMATQVAAVHLRQGLLEKATAQLHHALSLQEEAQDRTGAARTLSRLAEVDLARQDYAAARQKLRLALTVQEEMHDRVGESTSQALWGMLEMQSQRPEKALPHFQRAIAIYQELGHLVDLASTLPVAGHILYTLERFSESRQYFTMAEPLLKHLGQNAMLASIRHQMGIMDLLEGSLESALDHFREALFLRGETGDQPGEAATFFHLGQLARMLGLEAGALRLIGLSWRLSVRHDLPDGTQQETLFRALAQEMNLDASQADALLERIWNDYLTDGGKAFFQAIFGANRDSLAVTG